MSKLSHPVHFVMCNPPFFECAYDAQMDTDEGDLKKNKKRPPSSANTACSTESVTEGGETQFVINMFQESLNLKDKVKIFTVMLGKKRSVKNLKKKLYSCGEITNLIHTEFSQGMTKRWGLAWTFDDQVKLTSTVLSYPIKKKKLLTMQIPIDLKWVNLKTVFDAVMHWLKIELEINQIEVISQSGHKIELEIKTNVNTWIHQRRKRRARKRATFKLDQHMEDIESTERVKRKYPEEKMEIDSASLVDQSSVQHNQESKKTKEENEIIISKDEEQYLLHCSLILRQKYDWIEFEMKTKEKAKSKESVYQLYQFFKNKIFN